MFAFGFAKSDRANLAPDEVAAFKKAAAIVLALTQEEIAVWLATGMFTEIDCGDANLQE